LTPCVPPPVPLPAGEGGRPSPRISPLRREGDQRGEARAPPAPPPGATPTAEPAEAPPPHPHPAAPPQPPPPIHHRPTRCPAHRRRRRASRDRRSTVTKMIQNRVAPLGTRVALRGRGAGAPAQGHAELLCERLAISLRRTPTRPVFLPPQIRESSRRGIRPTRASGGIPGAATGRDEDLTRARR